MFTLQEENVKSSAVVAGDRKFDVYMGVDVFGRGTYGGGEWNVSDILIMNLFLNLYILLCLNYNNYCNFRRMSPLMCVRRMMYQLQYLHLDGSMRLSNLLILKLLKISNSFLSFYGIL